MNPLIYIYIYTFIHTYLFIINCVNKGLLHIRNTEYNYCKKMQFLFFDSLNNFFYFVVPVYIFYFNSLIDKFTNFTVGFAGQDTYISTYIGQILFYYNSVLGQIYSPKRPVNIR